MNTSTPWEPYRVCELKKKATRAGTWLIKT